MRLPDLKQSGNAGHLEILSSQVPNEYMTNSDKQLTHAELAKGLSVSRSYVSRLSRLGMPTNSIQLARAWIKKRSESIGTDSGSLQTLAEARREKIRLECEILTLRLERERDNLELVSVHELQKFMSAFMTYMDVSLVSHAESLTNEIAGKQEIEIYSHLRKAFSTSLYLGALGYIKGGGAEDPDPRLVSFAEKYITERHGWWAKGEWKDSLEQNLVALIKRAQEQPA